jgi:hypothetical protein
VALNTINQTKPQEQSSYSAEPSIFAYSIFPFFIYFFFIFVLVYLNIFKIFGL